MGERTACAFHRQYKGQLDPRIYYRLPRETREYVPRVLAAAWLFLHPEGHNLGWPSLAGETVELVLERDTSVDELTICLGQQGYRNGWFRTLRNLNPRLSPGERIEAGESLEVPSSLIPVYRSQCLEGDFVELAAELHGATYPHGSTSVYVVQPGDTLARIASLYRCVSTQELAAINNIRPPRYLIRAGQRIRTGLQLIPSFTCGVLG
jgi:membrane-bound lytic murein transglycosylase D